MAKEKKEQRPTRPVHLFVESADELRTIADARGITMAEAYEKYGGSLNREYRKVVVELYAAITVGGEG